MVSFKNKKCMSPTIVFYHDPEVKELNTLLYEGKKMLFWQYSLDDFVVNYIQIFHVSKDITISHFHCTVNFLGQHIAQQQDK